MKHTKGQWYTSGKSINIADQHLIISEDKGQNVAICYGVSNAEEAQANAHLMTAAPEMLEACILALNDFEMEGIELNHDTVTALRAALNKAEGEA